MKPRLQRLWPQSSIVMMVVARKAKVVRAKTEVAKVRAMEVIKAMVVEVEAAVAKAAEERVVAAMVVVRRVA